MAQAQGFCVFCGRPGLTKQHIVPDRLSAILGRPDVVSPQLKLRSESQPERFDVVDDDLIIKQGAFHIKKLRIVCGEHCNSGWMRALEERASSVFEPLVRGQSLYLSADQQHLLAAWASQIAMVAEYTDPEYAAISQADRTHLMINGEPPPNWRIWLGHFLGKDKNDSSYNHHGLIQPYLDWTIKNDKNLATVQTSTITLSRLVFHCFSERRRGSFRYNVEEKCRGIIPIWPIKTENLNWKKAGSMNEADRNWLSMSLPGLAHAQNKESRR
ncbi:hypothetical protein [Methylobacterium marchantiae]|uniref:HNH endonuclease n=1 Tax=Methylobacterium marchantiae TaxID=600331 RepID=A0ABW3WXK0_9HYPH|nr:hypothetical protein AIGOOFII_3284 [Methylobacterium marchantiae]